MDPEINLPCRQTGSGGQESKAFRRTGETEEWILKSPICHAELVSASIISSRMWILK